MTPKLRMSYAVSTLIVSSVTTFLLPLDYTVASVALRDIHRDFSVSFSDQQWVINGYTMAFAALLMAGGGLADLFGRRKVFLSGLALFTAASLLAGLAPAVLWLNVGRVAQGIGAAGMFSSSLALLVQEFTGPRRVHAFAVFGVASGLGASLGPFIGGLAVNLGGWRWAFLLNAPFGIAMLILGLMRTRESKDPHATRMDLKGLVLFSGAVLLVVYSIVMAPQIGWTSPTIVATLAAGAVLAIVFVFVELRQTYPLIDLRLFANRTFLGASLAPLVLSIAFWGLFLYTPLYFQGVLGYSPLQAGMAMLPFAIPLFGAGPLGARLANRISSRALLAIGQLLVAAGATLLAFAPLDSDWTNYAIGGLISGLGTGLINGEMSNVAISIVPAARSGMASGINSTMRIVGMNAGFGGIGAVMAVAVSHDLTSQAGRLHGLHQNVSGLATEVATGNINGTAASVPAPVREGFRAAADHAFATGMRTAFIVGACVALLGAVASFALIRRPQAGTAPEPVSAPPLADAQP
ncbi:MFS transporter [Streptomyces sp. GS7]|uniref:MFS transporter n=1 Tax=Streptomyces sp. GS7 TaxID=2692234 RepID=UPI001317D5E2|nr:MFS transporter [Streptomyces sp. GS7]QHC22074.1 DHA2 family efflux MFS transporter permease subunit [Streptomyces sp. GS7]